MTNEVKFKSVQCIEWIVQTSRTDSNSDSDSDDDSADYDSKTFSLQSLKCHLEFTLSKDCYGRYYKKGCLCLKTNGVQQRLLATVTVRINNYSRKSVHLGSIESGNQMVWEGDFCSSMNNALLTFEIIFLSPQEDKCLQTGSYLNTDAPVESLSEDFAKLLDADQNHDAEIRCGEHSIKAHKIILSTRSEVFKAMLQSDMQEGRTGIVEIKDIDTNFIEEFVKYLYTGTMPELTVEKAKVLYETGDKYAVKSLMLRCSEYLQDNLSPENACQCLALADAHSDQKLKDTVITYILNKKLYLQDERWLPFCESHPRSANEAYKSLVKTRIASFL